MVGNLLNLPNTVTCLPSSPEMQRLRRERVACNENIVRSFRRSSIKQTIFYVCSFRGGDMKKFILALSVLCFAVIVPIASADATLATWGINWNGIVQAGNNGDGTSPVPPPGWSMHVRV